MQIQPCHRNFKMPEYGSVDAAAFDLFMPESGSCNSERTTIVSLGFKAAVPEGCMAILVPRSGVGFKHGVELNNTVGVIDADYRGEWFAALRLKPNVNQQQLSWEVGDRLLQVAIVPIRRVNLQPVTELPITDRNEGGLGSTGK